MGRRGKVAGLLLSAAVLAGACLLAAYRAADGAAPAFGRAGSGAETVSLAPGSARELTALSWFWQGETVNLRRDGETGRWINADDDACPIDDARAEALARAAAGLTGTAEGAGTADLARYGLDKPALTVIAATEEAMAGWDVGSMTAAGEFYLRVHGTEAVYRTEGELPTAFRVGTADILALEAVPGDIGEVTALAVSSDAGDYTIAWDGSGWYRTDGESPSPLDETGALGLYELVTELELTDCVTWQGAPEEYGFQEPQATARLTYRDRSGQERSFTLEFGDYVDSGVYVRFAGSAMIFRAPGAVPDGLMYPRWDQITPVPVVSPDPAAMASIALTLDGKDYEITRLEETVDRPVGERDETVPVTDVIYSLNGWVLDTSRMNSWLDSFGGLIADGAAPEGEGRESLFSVTFVWKDTESPPFTLEIRNYDSVHYLCLAGDARLLIPRGPADGLMNTIRGILKSE